MSTHCLLEEPGGASRPEWRPSTVLVVDDDPCLLDLLTELLVGEQYHVLRAASGRHALRLVTEAEEPPQLFLFDHDLGEMTGLELYDLLHVRPGYESIPAILVSAYLPDQHEIAKRSMIGLSKPYDIDALLVRVASVISTGHVQV